MYQIQYGNLILGSGESKGACLSGLTITIHIKEVVEVQEVYVCNKIWVNKEVFLGSYSNEFTHKQILNDIAQRVCDMNGYTLIKIR